MKPPEHGDGAAGEQARPEPPQDGVLRIYPPTDGAHAAALADCSRAYARGDFAAARRLAREVTAGTPSVAERGFADEILRRTAIDPVAVAVALGCFALFWLVIYLTLWR